jgi:hypothetical protein
MKFFKGNPLIDRMQLAAFTTPKTEKPPGIKDSVV